MSDGPFAAPAAALSAAFSPPPKRLALAVSGGGDSMALMELAAEWGGAGLVVLTVDHGLRPEAAEEAALVARRAAALGLGFAALRWRWDGAGNLSEAAREGRYAAMAAACMAEGIGDVALAHTQDDNIESLFLGLMRGAGLDGLCGMRRSFIRGGVTFHRPLLDIPRAALRAVLRERGVRWAEDPTNENPAYDRARIRAALADMGLDGAQLARSIANLAATRRDIGAELVARLAGAWRIDGPDLVFDLGHWAGLSPEFRRRALIAGLRFIAPAGPDHPPRAASLMPLVGRDWRAAPGPVTLAGVSIGAEGPGLRLTREAAAAQGPVAAGALWDGRWRFTAPNEAAETRALGEEGLRQIATRSPLPRRSALAAPALWRGGKLLCAPHAGEVKGAAGTFLLEQVDEAARFEALLRG